MQEREICLVYRTRHGVFRARCYWDGADLVIIEIRPRWFDSEECRDLVERMAEGYDNYHFRFPPRSASLS
jgi:hypothetical protein